MHRFAIGLLALTLGWGAISPLQAAPVGSAKAEWISSFKLAPGERFDRDISFNMYPGAPGTLHSVKIQAGLSIKPRRPFLCDDPIAGLHGTCDNNGIGYDATIDILGSAVSEVRRNFDLCYQSYCGGTNDLGYGYLVVEHNVVFTGNDAESIFAGMGSVFLDDIVRINSYFDPLCVSGSCLLIPMGDGGQTHLYIAVTYDFDPIPYDRSNPSDIIRRLPGMVAEPSVFALSGPPLALAVLAVWRRKRHLI